MVLKVRLELTTYALRGHCSTNEKNVQEKVQKQKAQEQKAKKMKIEKDW